VFVTDFDPTRFAAEFQGFLEWVNEHWTPVHHRNEVVALVADYLGAAAAEHSVVARTISVFDG
jgi:hypothetical protein